MDNAGKTISSKIKKSQKSERTRKTILTYVNF